MCNICNVEPLPGIRFHCNSCTNLDICEECFDKFVVSKQHNISCHNESHVWEAQEEPSLAGGFDIHDNVKCQACKTCPIVGYRFYCLECHHMDLCQKCFFLKKEPKNHSHKHAVELIIESDCESKLGKCDHCGIKSMVGVQYKCSSCLHYELCESCFLKNVPTPRHITSHKTYHKFLKISK